MAGLHRAWGASGLDGEYQVRNSLVQLEVRTTQGQEQGLEDEMSADETAVSETVWKKTRLGKQLLASLD